MTAVYAEASDPGTLELADALGRAPRRRRHRPLHDEWPDGIHQRVPLLPQQAVPCDSQGDPNKWASDGANRYNAALCNDCPCVVNCLAYALKWDVAGTWGGTSRAQRGAIRVRAGLPDALPITLGSSPSGGPHPSWSRTAAPNEDYVAAALGLFDDLEIARDEARAAMAVRAEEPAGDVDATQFTATCSNCRQTGGYAEVVPERVMMQGPRGKTLTALYTCQCGYSWVQAWKDADVALSALATSRGSRRREEDRRNKAAREQCITECLGLPAVAVVTRLGAWISSMSLDETGCVTQLELRWPA